MILVITFVYHYALHMHLDILSCPLSTVLLTPVCITSSFDDLWTNKGHCKAIPVLCVALKLIAIEIMLHSMINN